MGPTDWHLAGTSVRRYQPPNRPGPGEKWDCRVSRSLPEEQSDEQRLIPQSAQTERRTYSGTPNLLRDAGQALDAVQLRLEFLELGFEHGKLLVEAFGSLERLVFQFLAGVSEESELLLQYLK